MIPHLHLHASRLAGGLFLAVIATVVPAAAPVPGPPDVRVWAVRASSEAVEAPKSFGLAGVTWASGAQPPAGVAISTSADGRKWSPWTDLQLQGDEEAPDPGSGEAARAARVSATAPVWVGEAKFVRVRFEGRRPSGAKVRLIDPGPDPKPHLRPAGAEAARPGIVSRSGWGADESMRRGAPSYAPSLKAAFVHHTATGNDYPASDSARIVRSIYAYHVDSNGWDDIGYNFLVDRHGQIFEGRAGGIDRPVVGAHAKGFNTATTGVAVIGTFNSGSPPPAALQALERLLSWRLDVAHVDPQSTVELRSKGSDRYPDGATARLPAISGHRDTGHTSCPGGALYEQLPTLRSAVAGIGLPKIYNPSVSRTVITPNGDGVAESSAAEARIAGGESWRMDVLTPAGSAIRSAQGTGDHAAFTWDGRDASQTVRSHGTYRLRLTASGSGSRARPADTEVLLAAWPEGSMLKGSSATVYLLRGGKLASFRSAGEFLSSRRFGEVAKVSNAAIAAYPSDSAAIGFREGALLREPSGRVSVVSDGARRPVRSMKDFEAFGFKKSSLIHVSEAAARTHPLGDPIRPSQPRPDGFLVRSNGSSTVYWIQDGLRRQIRSLSVYRTWFRSGETVRVADHELALIPMGPPLGLRDGTLATTDNDSRVWFISEGRRRHIRSADTFRDLGLRFSQVRTVGDGDLALHAEGPAI